jgi:hypothetical protein
VVHSEYNENMASQTKSVSRKSGTRAVRQSVTIPAPLAVEVRRVARERRLTISRALVTLAERGIRAEKEAKDNLQTTYRRFLKEQDPGKKEEAGKDLMRAVFGKHAIAEDPIL